MSPDGPNFSKIPVSNVLNVTLYPLLNTKLIINLCVILSKSQADIKNWYKKLILNLKNNFQEYLDIINNIMPVIVPINETIRGAILNSRLIIGWIISSIIE